MNDTKSRDAIQVISTVGEYRSLLIDRSDVVSVLLPELFPDAPGEVVGWLHDLQQALNRDEYTGDLEAALGIRIVF
jgi:hypothetical protein